MNKEMRLLLVYQRSWGKKFGQFFLEKYQEEFKDGEIGIITVKQDADQFFLQNNDLEKINYYSCFDNVRDFFAEYLNGDDYDIKEICEYFGINTVWPLLQATRNHIKNYKKKYYYSYEPALTDEELLMTIKAYFKYIREIDREFNPNFILLPNPVETFNILLELYANKKNIPIRYIALTPVRGYYQYVKTKDQGGSIIESKFVSGADYSKYRDDAIKYIEKFREEFIVPECAYHDSSGYLHYKLKDMAKLAYKVARAAIRNEKIPKGIHADYAQKIPRLLIRDYFLKIRYYNKIKDFRYNSLPQDKFVFFPLQMQPELAIDVLAPYFNNQIEVARQIAMSLPYDYTLVVKDHPIMVGLRSPKYLEKIQKLPNVKLVDYSIRTSEILKKCSAVVATTGSVVFESTVMGIPVIQLGNLASSFLFNNVQHVTDMTKLTDALMQVIGTNFMEDAEFNESLIRYISIIMEYGINTNYYEMWEKNKEGNMVPLWEAFKKELCEALG